MTYESIADASVECGHAVKRDAHLQCGSSRSMVL